MRDAPSVRRDPRSVPGYDRALALGLTPQVPATPPTPVTVNSRRVLVGTALLAAAGMGAFILVVETWSPTGPVLGLLATMLFAGVAAGMLGYRMAVWREIGAGYCRMDTMVALFSRDPEGRFPASQGLRGAPWDLRGLWRLDDRGGAVRPPSPDVLPAGLYPSPHRPGELELWTGEAWAYRYTRPSQPFL